MARFFDSPTIAVVRPGTVSFIHKLAGSSAFKTMFKEGMGLVEEAAAYLDGPGREESRQLRRPAALAYRRWLSTSVARWLRSTPSIRMMSLCELPVRSGRICR